jgi:hypothetical protein
MIGHGLKAAEGSRHPLACDAAHAKEEATPGSLTALTRTEPSAPRRGHPVSVTRSSPGAGPLRPPQIGWKPRAGA